MLSRSRKRRPFSFLGGVLGEMAYSYSKLFQEVTGRAFENRPVFDPPRLTALRKPIAQSTIGMFVSCGAQLPSDPPLGETEDISFRLVHRDTPVSKLAVSHKTKVRKWAVEDLNVAFPLERMKELEAEGTIGRLAHTSVSVVGSIQRFSELVEQTIPAIKQVYESQGVDLVFVFPFCPACHRACAVVARALEARGLPTLSMSVLLEAAEETKPPRTCFLDFPLGCPAGRPHEAEQQRAILRAALDMAPKFDRQPWHIERLPFQWSRDGSRAWEEEVSDLYRNGGLKIVMEHRQAHHARGESLVGHEREFVVRCNC
jgi:D-proline reductase (dithiol) PrdB